MHRIAHAAVLVLPLLLLGPGCKKDGAGAPPPPASAGEQPQDASSAPAGRRLRATSPSPAAEAAAGSGCVAEGRWELDLAFQDDPDLPPGASACPGRPIATSLALEVERGGGAPAVRGTGAAARWRFMRMVAASADDGACEVTAEALVDDPELEGTGWVSMTLTPDGTTVSGAGRTMFEDPEGIECGEEFAVRGTRSSAGGPAPAAR